MILESSCESNFNKPHIYTNNVLKIRSAAIVIRVMTKIPIHMHTFDFLIEKIKWNWKWEKETESG